jgi:hypothetical protein
MVSIFVKILARNGIRQGLIQGKIHFPAFDRPEKHPDKERRD